MLMFISDADAHVHDHARRWCRSGGVKFLMKACRLLMGFGDTANIIQIYPSLPPRCIPPNRLMRTTANTTHISDKYSKYTKLVKVDSRQIFRGIQFIIYCEKMNFKGKNIETICTRVNICQIWSIFLDLNYWADAQSRNQRLKLLPCYGWFETSARTPS